MRPKQHNEGTKKKQKTPSSETLFLFLLICSYVVLYFSTSSPLCRYAPCIPLTDVPLGPHPLLCVGLPSLSLPSSLWSLLRCCRETYVRTLSRESTTVLLERYTRGGDHFLASIIINKQKGDTQTYYIEST